MKIKRDWRNMSEPVSVGEAASRRGWSELTIWMLIRQRKVKWAIRGRGVLVDMVQVRSWADRNKELASELQGRISVEQVHPMTAWKEK